MPNTLGSNSKMSTFLRNMASQKKNQVMPISQNPRKLQVYLVLQWKKMARKKTIGRVKEISLIASFVNRLATLLHFAGQ